ncbi:uncharacterized protein METZ01_LOCUS365919, partial [marine metagenome]
MLLKIYFSYILLVIIDGGADRDRTYDLLDANQSL